MKYCIKIETKETFELFDNIKKAFKYCEKNNKIILSISLVLANNTYKEEDKTLNYEDKADTIFKEVLK